MTPLACRLLAVAGGVAVVAAGLAGVAGVVAVDAGVEVADCAASEPTRAKVAAKPRLRTAMSGADFMGMCELSRTVDFL